VMDAAPVPSINVPPLIIKSCIVLIKWADDEMNATVAQVNRREHLSHEPTWSIWLIQHL